jgi:hypothetical protein
MFLLLGFLCAVLVGNAVASESKREHINEDVWKKLSADSLIRNLCMRDDKKPCNACDILAHLIQRRPYTQEESDLFFQQMNKNKKQNEQEETWGCTKEDWKKIYYHSSMVNVEWICNIFKDIDEKQISDAQDPFHRVHYIAKEVQREHDALRSKIRDLVNQIIAKEFNRELRAFREELQRGNAVVAQESMNKYVAKYENDCKQLEDIFFDAGKSS